MRNIKLRVKLSLTFASLVLLTVLLVSLLANLFINSAFKQYVTYQQEEKTQELVSSIRAQYNHLKTGWDADFIHTIGMNALYDGYIVKVTDANGQTLWDAEACDMASCKRMMNTISTRMKTKYPRMTGEFTSRDFDLFQNGAGIGTASISYYGPYFLNDNDFHFLDALNKALISIGISCLILSVAVGLYMSKRISEPVSKAAEAARKMSGGDYAARIDGKNDTIELSELVDAVNHLAESLSYQEDLRKRFTADVSHELRTPVTSMQTHLEAMTDGLWEPTPERLASCYEEALRIGTIVKDLENLAGIDSEDVNLHKTEISLPSLWHKVIDSFEMEIGSKSLTVTLSGDAPKITADENRIRQVAVNLLSNAIKYTPPCGHIGIALSRTEEYAVFTVIDDGIGISENETRFVFERFYRTDKSRNRKTGGSGIGLSIVKSIVEAHGGKVEAESLDNGSCFRVMLPL